MVRSKVLLARIDRSVRINFTEYNEAKAVKPAREPLNGHDYARLFKKKELRYFGRFRA